MTSENAQQLDRIDAEMEADKNGDVNRRELLGRARALVQALEKPEEAASRMMFEVSPGAITADELATRAKQPVEPLFIVRVMRVLTAIGYAAEADVMTYTATPLSRAMTNPQLEAQAVHSYEHSARVVNRMPEYFSRNGYKCPDDQEHGPFQYALGTEPSFFEFLHGDPVRRERFDRAMTGNKGLRRHWFEWFPVREHLLAPAQGFLDHVKQQPDAIFLVDMGGGKGHHLDQFRQAFPETGGHLVLQDLAGTIEALESPPAGIHAMVHDSFTKQPIIGSKVYYTHFFLHDFPDQKCRTMLRQIAEAMRSGYSRILLNEIVIPERDCPSYFATLDITMMASLAAKQRSLKEWTDLVESAGAGLRVANIWVSPDPGDFEGIVEIELADGSTSA